MTFDFPACWKDEERMNVLFAPFRSRTINPTAWDSKIKFWTELIEQWCRHHKKILISPIEFNNHFQRNGKIPTCLASVFEDLNRNKVIRAELDYAQMTEPSWGAWAVQKLVTNPLSWGLKTMKGLIITEEKPNCFIHLPTVKFLGEDLIRKIPENQRGRLIDIHQLLELSGFQSKQDLLLVLLFLRSQKAVAFEKSPPQAVKFAKENEKYVAIDELDKTIYQLETNVSQLKKSIENLDKEKEKSLNDARTYVNSKMKPMAKHCLMRKKMLEKLIEKRSAALDNLENLLFTIEQAQFDSQVLQSYRSGASAIKTVFQKCGLTEESVAQTMDEVADVLADHNEIEQTLSGSLEGLSDAEALEELEALLAEEPPTEKASPEAKLPDVPNADLPQDKDIEHLENRMKALLS